MWASWLQPCSSFNLRPPVHLGPRTTPRPPIPVRRAPQLVSRPLFPSAHANHEKHSNPYFSPSTSPPLKNFPSSFFATLTTPQPAAKNSLGEVRRAVPPWPGLPTQCVVLRFRFFVYRHRFTASASRYAS